MTKSTLRNGATYQAAPRRLDGSLICPRKRARVLEPLGQAPQLRRHLLDRPSSLHRLEHGKVRHPLTQAPRDRRQLRRTQTDEGPSALPDPACQVAPLRPHPRRALGLTTAARSAGARLLHTPLLNASWPSWIALPTSSAEAVAHWAIVSPVAGSSIAIDGPEPGAS